MVIITTLVFCLFTACLLYPPTEFVTAGFTIPQLFEGLLGSEDRNFVRYHMRRTSITMVVHSFLPMIYSILLFLGGWRSKWLVSAFLASWVVIFLVLCKIISWWVNKKQGHPVVKTLLPYVTDGIDWRVVAADFNTEYHHQEKALIELGSTSKFMVTPRWLIKVSQYRVDIVRHAECRLVVTATDNHNISVSGENEVQYLNLKVIPTREGVRPFSFRIPTAALRDLQPTLLQPLRVPDHLSLLPTMMERFVTVFRDYVRRNPMYIPAEDEEIEQCIGCLQEKANVKIERRCLPAPPHLAGGLDECQTCRCRVVWCVSCMARWWATRAGSAPPAEWLSGRCTCPVCRAAFCMLDLRPVHTGPSACAATPASPPSPASP